MIYILYRLPALSVKATTGLRGILADLPCTSHLQCQFLTHSKFQETPMHLIPDPERFDGIQRDYTHQDVLRLSGRFRIRHTLAEMGATRLWQLLKTEPFVPTLGALTGNQAVQQVKAGLQAIYLSGWQVAADANTAGQMYPDQSLYPVDSVPSVVQKINAALLRADQIDTAEGRQDEKNTVHWFAPIVADAEAG